MGKGRGPLFAAAFRAQLRRRDILIGCHCYKDFAPAELGIASTQSIPGTSHVFNGL